MDAFASPYAIAKALYPLPFELFPFQVEAVNELAPYGKAGYFFDPGLGKTSTATVSAFYKLRTGDVDRVLVIVPPMVLETWRRWLQKIPGLDFVMYRGTPAQRKQISLDATFVVVGLQIFKKDIVRFNQAMGSPRTLVIVDEAHSIKNTGSDNFRKVRQFAADKHLMLLTGTPVTRPTDAYAYTKLIHPRTYPSLVMFESLHVGARDFFGNVTQWKNLDLLAQNLGVQTSRVIKEEVLHDLPQVTYTPLPYELHPSHRALYEQLSEQQLLKLEDGGKIDATSSSKLYNALQQIVVNWGHFSGDPTKESESLKLVDYVLEEIGDRKLIVFGNYRMTNRLLKEKLSKFGAVAAFGDNTVNQNMRAVNQFIEDPKIRVLVGQPTSVGVGVDGLQEVCSDVLFIECPTVPRDFHQALSRVYRQGQRFNVNVRIGLAEGTIQHRLHQRLLDNDQLANTVQGGFQDLRDAIYGK